MNTLLKEYLPCNKLKPFVELFWKGSFNINANGPLYMQMIPTGCLELIIHLDNFHFDLEYGSSWLQTPDSMILGLFTKPYKIRFKKYVKVFAIRFKPEGIYRIFRVSSSVLIDRFEDVSMVLGPEFILFSKRLMEETNVTSRILRTENYLLKKLLNNKIDMNYVHLAAELIRTTKGVKIKDLSKKLCVCERQLEREFKGKLGVSPKQYHRIIRVNEVVRLLNKEQVMSLTSVADQCGYFDQSHFINDFKKITGKKPSYYIRERDQFISNPGLAHYAEQFKK